MTDTDSPRGEREALTRLAGAYSDQHSHIDEDGNPWCVGCLVADLRALAAAAQPRPAPADGEEMLRQLGVAIGRAAKADGRAEDAERRLAAVRRALDDELANLADDGARLSHSVVRRIEAILAAESGTDTRANGSET